MQGDDQKDDWETVLGNLVNKDFTRQKKPPKKPFYTTKELIEILDDSNSTLCEIRQDELFCNRDDAEELAETQEPSATITSQHEDWSSDSQSDNSQESVELCDRPFRVLQMTSESSNSEDMEERKSPELTDLEPGAESKPWEIIEMKLDDSQMTLQDSSSNESNEDMYNSEQAKEEQRIKQIFPWSDDEEDDEDKPKRRRLSEDAISTKQAEIPKNCEGSQDEEQEPIEAPTTKTESTSTQTSELNSDQSSFFVNLRFSTEDFVHVPLESCENTHQSQTLNIETVEEYLVEATAATPVIGSQCTEYFLREVDFVKILAESVACFYVLSKASDKLTVQFMEELEDNYGGPEMYINNEIDELSQYFHDRLLTIGENLCEKLANVEVRDFNFFKVLDCVLVQLAQRTPPIVLSENQIWQRLAEMLKPCRVVSEPYSKTFEKFLRLAIQPLSGYGRTQHHF